MKIALITALAGPGRAAGGVWEVVATQAASLQARGHEVSIIAGWLDECVPDVVDGLSVNLVPLRRLHPSLGLRGLWSASWLNTVSAELDRSDVAHVHLCRDLLTMRIPRLAARLKVPVVAQPHGMLVKRDETVFQFYDFFFTRRALSEIDHYLVLSMQEREDLLRLGVHSQHVSVVENAVQDFGYRWTPPESPMLLFAGRLHPRKGVILFAETISELLRRGEMVHGVIAGADEGDLSRLRSYISEEGLEDRITYLGALEKDALRSVMREATALMVTSQLESFGLVSVEALSLGTPVITTSTNPLAETLRFSDAALVSVRSASHLADAAQQLVHDSNRAWALSRAGRRLFMENWRPSTITARIESVYDIALALSEEGSH